MSPNTKGGIFSELSRAMHTRGYAHASGQKKKKKRGINNSIKGQIELKCRLTRFVWSDIVQGAH